MNRFRADLILLLVALIWGSAFVVQRVGTRYRLMGRNMPRQPMQPFCSARRLYSLHWLDLSS